MKIKKQVELYLLFEIMKPRDIVKLFPEYNRCTVQKYYKEWRAAKKRVKHMFSFENIMRKRIFGAKTGTKML